MKTGIGGGIFRAAWLILGGEILTAALAALLDAFLAWKLGPLEYGLLRVAVAIPTLLIQPLNLHLGTAIVFHGVRSPQQLHALLATAMAYGATVGGAVLLIGTASAALWTPAGAQPLFLSCLAMLPFLLMQEYLRIGFLVQERLRWYNAVQPFEKALAMVLVLGAGASAGWSALHAALPMLLALAASVAAGLVALGLSRTWLRSVAWSRFREMLRFSRGIVIGQICFTALFQINVPLVGKLAGSREAGLYAFAANLAWLLLFLPKSVIPAFGRRLNELGKKEARNLTWRIVGAVSLVMLLLGGVLCLALPWAVRRFLPSYVDSLPMLQYLLPAAMTLGGSMCLVTQAFYSSGSRIRVNLALAMALALDLTLCLRYVPQEGGVGAAKAFCLSCFLLAGLLSLNLLFAQEEQRP